MVDMSMLGMRAMHMCFVGGERCIARHAPNEVTLTREFLLQPLSDVAAQWAAPLVPDDRIGTCGHEHAKKTIDDATSVCLIIKGPHVRLVERKGQS